jgi:nucleoid-associated protein YgaU
MKKGVFKMTADAKVGVLLGMFFIVVIIFLINGLPNFVKGSEPEDIQNVIIPPQTAPDLALDNNVVDRAVERLYGPVPLHPRDTEPPQGVVYLDDPANTNSSSRRDTFETMPINSTQSEQDNPSTQSTRQNQTIEYEIYTVKPGDTLPMIAKKYYGPEEGNRHVVINKLYEYNATVIKSADVIYVGDKLKIPLTLKQLMNPQQDPVTTPRASESLLRKFSGVFERVNSSNSSSVTEYVMKEGDNLWSIAQETLGSGNRYSEIVRLNKIRDPDKIPTGTRLKIPAK